MYQEINQTFTCDYIQFKENETCFDPWSDRRVEQIDLDLSVDSNLDWEMSVRSKKVIWNLNFDLSGEALYDQRALACFINGIRTFVNNLYLDYQKQTVAVCLYQGPLFLPLNWNAYHEENFSDWRKHMMFFPALKALYLVEALSNSLHHLASALPDDALPVVCFDPPDMPLAEMAQLLSREHFPYLFVGLKGHPLPLPPFSKQAIDATIGLTLPLHAFCSKVSLDLVERCLEDLEGKLRIVYESHLNESWDGLKTLILFPEFLSSQGRRKAQGFAAAGGEIVSRGKLLGLPNEVSWDEFRGRGI